MTQTRKPQAIFPDLPRDPQVINLQNGELTPAWHLFFDQFVSALQTNFKPEGFVMPPLSATNIANLGNISAAIGNIIYDSTNNQFKGIVVSSVGPPLVTTTKTFTLV